MSSEDTLLGNDWKVQLGSDASPPVYSDSCAMFDFGEVGEEKPLVDVTSYCDDARAYRGGLADGSELPFQANYITGDVGIGMLKDAYDSGDRLPIRIISKADVSPQESFEFAAIVRGWKVNGPIGAKSVATFTLKISGPVLWNR